MRETPTWADPASHIARQRPDGAVFYFSPAVLQATARRFRAGFPGLVTYAVKANPGAEVLANLVAAGIDAFDVASPDEMRAVRAVCPGAVLHYNNPVRSVAEVEVARAMGVTSCSVDDRGELAKLAPLPREVEVAVRLALPVGGAAYDFGSKFGVPPEAAAALLAEVAAMGFRPALTFHPGTQCVDPAAWAVYIAAAARVADMAGVRLARLNVGGGFAAFRGADIPPIEAVFAAIAQTARREFGPTPPALLCEPGRAMAAEAFTLGTRVKAMRADGRVWLNDGIYGGLVEARDLGTPGRITAIAPDGTLRRGAPLGRTVFGPTCDSLDRLPGLVPLPDDLAEGDYLLFAGMGAYSLCLATRFNGYGPAQTVTVAKLY